MIDFPPHKCGLSLIHNAHKDVYEKASDWVKNNDWFDWISPEQKQRAIETDEIWTLRWYPETPVGFIAIGAPTLKELLAYCLILEGDCDTQKPTLEPKVLKQ